MGRRHRRPALCRHGTPPQPTSRVPGSSCSQSRRAPSDELLVTSLPESAATSWLYGGGVSCHGLLCFDDHRDGTTYLLNPLTREMASVAAPAGRGQARWHGHGHRIAVGMDHLIGRYKILRVSMFFGRDQVIRLTRVEVLDQGSRSWRDIASALPRLLFGVPVYAAGSFWNAHLVPHRGALGLVDRWPKESVDVWVMAEESRRWVKEYSVPLRLPWTANGSPPFGEFLGCSGRKMMRLFLMSVLSYDPVTGELEYVQRGGASPARVMASVTVSLLSPAKLRNADKVVLPFTRVAKNEKEQI